jgi:hypothetical protein
VPIRKVTDPAILQQLGGGGNVVAPNPMFPGQLQGQGSTTRAAAPEPALRRGIALRRAQGGCGRATRKPPLA